MSVNFTGDLLQHRSIMTELILPEAIIHFKAIMLTSTRDDKKKKKKTGKFSSKREKQLNKTSAVMFLQMF